MLKRINKAFTMSEAIVIMVIMGIMGMLYFVGIKVYNPTQLGNDVKSKKILENLDQTVTLILAHHAPDYTLTYLNDKEGNFSLLDSDTENSTRRLANLFKEYLVIMDRQIEQKYIASYYSKPILKYNSTSTGVILNEAYSNFMMSENGTIYGFKLYGNCSTDETMANPPKIREVYTVPETCGSVFYDVNAYKGPNKLGSDQFIVPIGINNMEVKRK